MARFGVVPEVAKLSRPWCRVHTIAPPPSYEGSIGSLEAQIDDQVEGFPDARAFRMFVEFTEEERAAIAAGAPVEFAIFGFRMPPVAVDVWLPKTNKEEEEKNDGPTQEG